MIILLSGTLIAHRFGVWEIAKQVLIAMNPCHAVIAIAAVVGLIAMANAANAAPITYDFTSGPATINLGATETYTVSGVTITAASGTYGNAVGSPTNSSFSAEGVLVGN